MLQTIFKFSNNVAISKWFSVDDVVMGGKSTGKLSITEEGYGYFSGKISKENNGGFSSVHYRENIKCAINSKIILKVKGDGKVYQLRIKNKAEDKHGYIYNFKSTDEWQNFIIPLNEMEAYYRGNSLKMPNFNAEEIAEISIFIISNQAEPFSLLIESLELQNN